VLLRVGYADHTSWDMTFLRIDYNGHGYDAFVTDNNLARIRLSFKLDALPTPEAWTHIGFSWDENTGVRLYINGKLVAEDKTKAVLDAGLDQFGMAARTVSPHQVQSRYSWMRGSDYDELRIYDHALNDKEITTLSRGDVPDVAAYPAGKLSDPATKAEWDWRYGWNRPGDKPVELKDPVTAIRKVEFADAKDIKEFMYKATDGIAETTWPGVYNRSKLPGRDDYFPLPDWNVYVDGGKTLTLTLPDEAWNHLEIQGAAYGTLTYAATEKAAPEMLTSRTQGQERTWHQFADRKGGVLRFDNDVQETPIQEISAYHIGAGAVPAGTVQQSYFVRANVAADSPNLDTLKDFIAGRYSPDARDMVVAVPDGAPVRETARPAGVTMPIVHILLPHEFGASPANQKLHRSWNYGWENMHDGLDGIAIDLPALDLPAGSDGLIPLNIQIKDPVWPARNMLDVTVAVHPGQARTLWLDTRDRVLPNQSLYLTIASGAAGFNGALLDGARIRLVYKDRKEALKEHVADRLQQVRDNWGFLVEEHTESKREKLYLRLDADMTDLLRVDPENKIAREYWQDIMYGSQGHPAFVQPVPPNGVPLWAFRQLEDLKGVRRFVNWWVDNRQADFGDFGGGLSDDTDLVEQWPGLALMGVDPEKLRVSQMRVADAVYKNGMFTNGLSTLMLDELHSYEDGINSNSEAMYLNYGDPKVVERLMTTVAAYDHIMSVNPAGHLHINSNWFSGTDSYREGPWEWSKYYSYLVLHPGLLMSDFNNDPTAKRYIFGLMDSLLAHGKKDDKGRWSWPDEINWRTDAARATLPDNAPAYMLLWAAWRWSHDAKYLAPLYAAYNKGGSKALLGLSENTLDALGKRADWGAKAVKNAKADTA
ncbi:MAG: LamG-like jellyroll fold domain-containing protein, partial [Rhizomicrobium sp.]